MSTRDHDHGGARSASVVAWSRVGYGGPWLRRFMTVTLLLSSRVVATLWRSARPHIAAPSPLGGVSACV